MKKIFASAFLMLAFAAISFAQTGTPLFQFTKGQADADIVLKAISLEIKLSDTEFPAVRELLSKSAASQVELFGKPENKDPEQAKLIWMRQTAHIEGNLRNILGEDKFKLYQDHKAAIEAKAKELGKN